MIALSFVLMTAQVLTISIDPLVWTQARHISWPGNEKSVLVVGPEARQHAANCGVLGLADTAGGGYVFRLGEHCQRLVVLMDLSGGVSDPSRAEQFLAAHEAFHVAAQMYGAKVPMEFLGIDSDRVHGFAGDDRFKEFYMSIGDLFASEMEGAKASCIHVESSYRALDPNAREYLDYKIFWEWPAEYYAQQVVFQDDLAGYSKFRGKLFNEGNEGFDLFVSGVKAGMVLDKVMGRERWQERVAEGASMLDLILGRYGCDPVPRSVPVRMKRVDFPRGTTLSFSPPHPPPPPSSASHPDTRPPRPPR